MAQIIHSKGGVREQQNDATTTLKSVLTNLGMILTPAGVIALFCQVLDVSPQSTAATSLAAVVLISICIYRKFINRQVPASILMALLVSLGAVFFFNYQSILLKDTGLIKYYHHSNDFLSQIDKNISQSQQEIWFFGTNFNISAGERRKNLLAKLMTGVKIRYLIFAFRSTHLDDLAKDFDQSPAELRSECDKGIQSILELRKQWRLAINSASNPGELDVRIFSTHPHARFYIFDPGRVSGTTFFIPYINAINSPDVAGFLLQNIDGGVFKGYFSGIRKLWSASEKLDDYLRDHPDVAAPL